MTMKTSLLIIIIFFAAFQINAQGHRLGYHRSDGSYVILQNYSYSEGYSYDSWRCNENTANINRNISKRKTYTYPNVKRGKAVTKYTYPRSSHTYNKSYYNNYPSKDYNNNSKYSIYYVTTESLNVRSGPSSSYKLTGTLNYGESVTVLDSHSNGWNKIQYLYFDPYTSSFSTKYGYVAGNYLSASKPYNNYDYKYNDNRTYDSGYDSYNSKYNKYNSNIYSSFDKVDPNYGIGGLTIWTNCSTDGEIKVYLDGDYIGVLSRFFTNGVQKCGEPGTIFIEKEAGRYKLEAKGNRYTWSGTVTIVKNKCLIQGLER